MPRIKTTPTFRNVGGIYLIWVGDKHAVLLGQGLHPRACGEVIGILFTAMQYDEERHLWTSLLRSM
jgi:hypothetical protein